MRNLEAIDRWCGSSSPPVHSIDLLFLSNKIQLRGTENLTAGDTECASDFFMLTHLCPAVKWRKLGLLSFKDKITHNLPCLITNLKFMCHLEGDIFLENGWWGCWGKTEWKYLLINSKTKGGKFFRRMFWVSTTPCYLEKCILK